MKLSKTPAPKSERIYGSELNKPKSAESSSKASSIVLGESTINSIKSILDKHNDTHTTKKIPLSVGKAVVRRGMGAYSSTHRPTISDGKPNSRVAWGLARLNAFVYKIQKGHSKSGKYTQDDDLIKELGIMVKKYKDGGLVAPNGKPSNLTTEQYKLVRTPAFKKWFGDWENDPANASKVVDENKEPLVVYHGTDKDFTIFDKSRAGELETIKTVDRKIGIYFSNKKSISSYYTKNKGKILECFLNVRNPLKTSKLELSTFEIEFFKEAGDDGIIWNRGTGMYINGKPVPLSRGEKPEIEYIVFEPNQIKLADGTNTTFDANNPDIRYVKGGIINNSCEYTIGGL